MKRHFPFHSNTAWPTLGMTALFAIVFGILEGGLWCIRLAAGNPTGEYSDIPEIKMLRGAILAGAAGVYAAHRLWRFHPACNRQYALWLKLSPWTVGKPLPLGPFHLVWQDAVVIGVLAAMAKWHAHVNPEIVVTVFGLVYLGGLSFLLVFTRQWLSCLVLGFLWPALTIPGVEGLPIFVLIAGIIAVIWWGHRQSLKAFPWEFLRYSKRPAGSILQMEMRFDTFTDPEGRKPSNIGWPFLALSPKIHCPSISARASFCLSLLFGWWSFCAIECAQMDPLPELILFFTIGAAIGRVAIYCSGLRPSFNVWGRMASGRIAVPGFDKIFLTPLVVVLLAIAGGVIVRRAGSWYPLAESCVIALIWHVLFSGGPTLRNWVLTGWHRFHPPAQINTNKGGLRPI